MPPVKIWSKYSGKFQVSQPNNSIFKMGLVTNLNANQCSVKHESVLKGSGVKETHLNFKRLCPLYSDTFVHQRLMAERTEI